MVNKNRKQMHAYNPDEIEQLRSVPLPLKLKCNMCRKNYNAANFSEKQKTDARWQIKMTGRIATNPRCFKCTGGQLVEIECAHCHKTKGLEAFAKVQRRKPDDAQCYSCTEIQLAREPVDEERYEDPTKAFINSESSSGRTAEYWSSSNSVRDTESSNGEWPETGSTDGRRRKRENGGIDLSAQFQQALSVSGEVSDTLIDSEFSYEPVKNAQPGTWSDVAGTRSWYTGTETASSTRSFNPNTSGRPSTQSVSGSAYSFNSSVAERSQSASSHFETKNGFAKVKAYVCILDFDSPSLHEVDISQKPQPQLQPEDDFSSPENSDSDDNGDDDIVL